MRVCFNLHAKARLLKGEAFDRGHTAPAGLSHAIELIWERGNRWEKQKAA